MDFTTITPYDVWLMPVLGGCHTVFLDGLATVLTSGWTWLALYATLLLAVIKNNETMAQIWLAVGAAALCVALSDGLADGIVKPLAMRPRPINDPAVRPLLDIVTGLADKNFSFFSAHAANTMSLCVFFSLLMRSRRLAVALALWSLVNCWTRIYLGMHYPSDIIVGLAWGGIVGTAVYAAYRHFYRRLSPKLHFISSQYTRKGYALGDINIILNFLLLTVAYAILRTLFLA